MENILRRRDVAKHLADIFALPLYRKVQPLIFSSHPPLRIYTDNATFWEDAFAKRHFQMMRLQLKGFHLMEWLPSAPGHYFTEAARLSRENAATHIDIYLNEYGLQGKSQMIHGGGVGSFRLASQRIDGMNQYFLGATSTGVSHEGIPIVLNEHDYQDIIPSISHYGGCLADLEGTLQILQMSRPAANTPLSLFYDPGTPRYCLVVDRLYLRKPSSEGSLVATAAIAFSLKNSMPFLDKGWAYASFHPGYNNGLNEAIDWLQDYAERHSEMHQPPILADFDEHYQHFAYPVEFPLQHVTGQTFDAALAVRYQHRYALKKTEQLFFLKRNTASPSQSVRNPVRTLLCFTPKDELFAEAFKSSLQALRRKNYIDVHVESDVLAGSGRLVELEREMEQTHLILLLLSPDFIADNYYYEEVAQRAMVLHEHGKAKVVLIYVRPVHYEGLPLEDLQILPENAIPVIDAYWKSVDDAFYDIVGKLQELIKTMV